MYGLPFGGRIVSIRGFILVGTVLGTDWFKLVQVIVLATNAVGSFEGAGLEKPKVRYEVDVEVANDPTTVSVATRKRPSARTELSGS